MEETNEGIDIDYERVENALASMSEAINVFVEENTDFFSREVEMLNQMNSNYVEQQRQILECFMYRLGNTLSVNLESCYQDVLDDFIRIKETEKAKNREKE